MKDFRTEWKKLANTKQITKADVFRCCLFKAIDAKSATSYKDRVEIALNLLKRAYTPITNKNKLTCSGMQSYQGLFNSIDSNVWLPYSVAHLDIKDFAETESEVANYNNLVTDVKAHFDAKQNEEYTYIFIRTDLSIEQMMVQGMHATLNLGKMIGKELPSKDLTKLNFVMCPARNQKELIAAEQFVINNGYKTFRFYEPDIDGFTAFASFPISYAHKSFMKGYSTLKFIK